MSDYQNESSKSKKCKQKNRTTFANKNRGQKKRIYKKATHKKMTKKKNIKKKDTRKIKGIDKGFKPNSTTSDDLYEEIFNDFNKKRTGESQNKANQSKKRSQQSLKNTDSRTQPSKASKEGLNGPSSAKNNDNKENKEVELIKKGSKENICRELNLNNADESESYQKKNENNENKKFSEIQKDKESVSNSMIPNSNIKEKIIENLYSNKTSLIKDLETNKLEENISQKNTSVPEKNIVPPSEQQIKNKKKNHNKIRIKLSNFKFEQKLSKKHIIEQFELIEHFLFINSRIKKNCRIIYKINCYNNRFSFGKFFLDFYRINIGKDQDNNSNSRENITLESFHGNISLEGDELRDIEEFNEIPINIHGLNKQDSEEEDNNDERLIEKDIKIFHDINANFGIYRKEYKKEPKIFFHIQ